AFASLGLGGDAQGLVATVVALARHAPFGHRGVLVDARGGPLFGEVEARVLDARPAAQRGQVAESLLHGLAVDADHVIAHLQPRAVGARARPDVVDDERVADEAAR